MDRLTTPACITGEPSMMPPVTTGPPPVAALAHDLKLPLQAVLGWVSRLRRNEIAPERRDAVLALIEKNTLLLGGLVSELVDVATGEPSRMSMTRAALDLTDLVARAVEGLRPMAERQGVAVRVAPAPPLAVCGNDAGLMRGSGQSAVERHSIQPGRGRRRLPCQ
jgi:signal transduction histidine kinase